jgi:Ca2+-binding EF-hand superfamily protein
MRSRTIPIVALLAAVLAVGGDAAFAGRDLVIDSGGQPIHVLVTATIDGKPIDDGRTEIVVEPQPLVDRLELFAALDEDGDGFVTAGEFASAERILARYDADGDGTLNQPELAPTEPLQPTPLRSGSDFPPGRFPVRWQAPSDQPDVTVEIKLIGRAFGRPKVVVTDRAGKRAANSSALAVTSETRKASFDVAGIGIDLDATPARITSEDVKRFFLLQLRQRDADKNGYLDEGEFLGLGLPSLDYKTADANSDGMLFPDELRAKLDELIARETNHVRLQASFERQPLFTKLDADGDMRLSRRELRDAHNVLASIDVDGDGRVSLAEFGGRYRLAFSVPNLLDGANPRMVAQVEAMPRGPSKRSADGPKWFAAMDRNGDGDVAAREFFGGLDDFKRLDADSDGLISPAEAESAEEFVSDRESR